MMNAVLLGFLLGSAALSGQDPETVPYLPLVYEVRFPPAPVKAEGTFHLIYELHLANFSRREVTLQKVEILGRAEGAIETYEGDRLSKCLTRPGKPLDVENKSVLEGGAQAVLFIMVSFKSRAEVPESLAHRVTAEYLRGEEEKVTLRGEGAPVTVSRKETAVIGPPVRPGVWLAGNCPGDGPVGHRLSLQPWNSKLVVNERYAIDFMKLDPEYRMVRGDRSKNANWGSYGEEVVAVADGVITRVKDGIVENTTVGEYAVPNSLESGAGNTIVLDIGQGSYAVYAHLKSASLRVKVGDHVRKGQALAVIGNSGISDAPHLHFHLLDANSVLGGEGLPFVFERFEQLGPFEQPEDRPDQAWSPSGKSTMRDKEMPLGDVVVKFPGRRPTD